MTKAAGLILNLIDHIFLDGNRVPNCLRDRWSWTDKHILCHSDLP